MAPLSARGKEKKNTKNYKVPDLKVMDILRANLKTIAVLVGGAVFLLSGVQ